MELVSTNASSSGPHCVLVLDFCVLCPLQERFQWRILVVCANIIAGMETAIETATTVMRVQAVSNRIILPSYSTSHS